MKKNCCFCSKIVSLEMSHQTLACTQHVGAGLLKIKGRPLDSHPLYVALCRRPIWGASPAPGRRHRSLLPRSLLFPVLWDGTPSSGPPFLPTSPYRLLISAGDPSWQPKMSPDTAKYPLVGKSARHWESPAHRADTYSGGGGSVGSA